MVEYHPISARDLSTIHHFGKKILPGICLGYGLIAVPHAARALGALERQRGRENPYIPKNERERQRAFDEQFAIRIRVAKLGWLESHCRKHHLHLQQIGGSQENGEETMV